MTAENRYIIIDEQLQVWRKGCVNLSNPHTNDDLCKKCEYRGKGMREKCCDFGDTDMEKIFRSHPYNTQAERDKVLDEILKWLCDMDGGDVVNNPKLGLFSSPQPFNTVGLIQKLQELRRQGKQEE